MDTKETFRVGDVCHVKLSSWGTSRIRECDDDGVYVMSHFDLDTDNLCVVKRIGREHFMIVVDLRKGKQFIIHSYWVKKYDE